MVKGNIELQKRRLKSRYPLINMNHEKGFSLIELAIALVVVGLLVGGGISLIAPLLKQQKYRENLELLKANMEYLVQYGLENNGKFGPYAANCTPILRYPLDAYKKPFLCFIAPELNSNSACASQTTSITVVDQQDNANLNNIAMVLISGGENFNIQTKPNDPIVIYPFRQEGIDDYVDDINRPEPYDDQVAYLTFFELKEKNLCVHSEERLRILNNSLPTAQDNDSYNATIYATGGVPFTDHSDENPKYEWCVEGKLPSGLRFECDAENFLSSDNCSSPDPYYHFFWGKCKNIKILGEVDLGDNDTQTYKLIFFVKDYSRNKDQKNFVLAVHKLECRMPY